MEKLNFGDKIIVLHESSIERGTLEETMAEGVEAYWVRYSPDGRDVVRKENIFSDDKVGKCRLIEAIKKARKSLLEAKMRLYMEVINDLRPREV